MADTTTTHLDLTKPEEFGSDDTWGAKLNDNLDALDALFDGGTGHAHTGDGEGPPLTPPALEGVSGGGGLIASPDSASFVERSIAGGAGIAVTDGDGAGGDPTVALDVPGLTGAIVDAADSVPIYDASAGGHRKVTVAQLLVDAKPATSTDNGIPRFDGTSGKLVNTSGPTLEDDGTLHLRDKGLRSGQLRDVGMKVNALGSISGAQDVDLSAGQIVTATVTGATTLSFTEVPPGDGAGFVLLVTNPGSNVTWPGSVLWPGGSAPSLTAAGTDQLVFVTPDGGTTWYGSVVGYDLS